MCSKIKTISMAVVLLLILAGWGVGCGKKGPPLPPLALIPPAPIQLTFQLTEDLVNLQWKLASEFQTKASDTEMDLEIYKATRPLTGDACRDCPLRFKKIAELPVTTLQHGESLERGYQYFYRLRIRQGDAVFSEYSETISFDLKQQF